ncbi:MAG TPA: site-2 protease family protein [Candidatus Acidoferrum sp.]|nr:site-2 protease family protein [Candidatus Acidoferrum sp.]
MTEVPGGTAENSFGLQGDFVRITNMVNQEFLIEESLVLQNVPTYYLKQMQETKQPFLRLLKNLETINMIAFLRKTDGRLVLRVVPKPQVKPSDVRINWLLLFATIATTFVTGYFAALGLINPFVGGLTFTAAILAILGTHEMGHKLTANRKGMEATNPYFIPGPPPFGTFGAVIMQKSVPPNRDALFDIGADGPIAGFIIATIVSFFGLMLLIPGPKVSNPNYIPVPLLWSILGRLLEGLKLMPHAGPNQDLMLHPITFAAWAGLVVTMLNLLPAGMLDGGHVVRSMAGEKVRLFLAGLSIVFLIFEGFIPMAILVVFLLMFKDPGPLDDVSSLTTKRKLVAIGLIAIFVLCIFPQIPTLPTL